MITNKGVKLAGTLPDAIQLPTIYSGAVPVGAPDPDGARAFLQAMKSPAGTAAIKESGLEPFLGSKPRMTGNYADSICVIRAIRGFMSLTTCLTDFPFTKSRAR